MKLAPQNHLGDPLEIGAAEVRGYRFGAQAKLVPHEHRHPVVIVVTSGGFDGVMNRRSYRRASGDIALLPGAIRHAGTIGAGGVRSLVLTPLTGSFEVDGEVDLPSFALIDGPKARRLAWRMGVEWGAGDEAAALAFEHCVEELFLLAAGGEEGEEDRPLPPGLRRARDFLETSLSQTPRLDDVAAQAGLSRAHLARTFRRAFGCSVGTYLRRRRLDRAAIMLRDTDRPISEVATTNGFYDQSHFTGAFRRWIGCPPGAFRHMQGHGRA